VSRSRAGAIAEAARVSIRRGFGPPPWPLWRRQWPLGLVLMLVVGGISLMLDQHVKRGTALLGGALLVAALLRSVLPTRDIGLLAVRTRVFDVLTTGLMGTAIVILTVVVPPRR
jgi:Protein of unknown function (DUF3017)